MRKTATIVHISSMPGDHGIGDIGAAIDVARWAAWAHLDLQFLPLTDPADGICPYTGKSAFARNWRLINLRMLISEGLISENDLLDAPAFSQGKVDFQLASQYKAKILSIAYENWKRSKSAGLAQRYDAFVRGANYWLEDYALYMALKERNQDAPWYMWEKNLAERDPKALASAAAALHDRVEAHMFFQFLFAGQWAAFRRLCRSLKVRLIGDMPIFVSHDSADVWAHQNLFKLADNHLPVVVAGVPPDYFSADGQLWGNPHYDWQAMGADDFRWWKERLRVTLALVDLVRIDHFRGFDQAWEVEASAKTAKAGTWVDAPGLELFEKVKAEFGDDVVIAEDLGLITQRVRDLRDKLGFPGMRVLQFGFSGATLPAILSLLLCKLIPSRCNRLRNRLLKLMLPNINLPHHYVRNSVAYTGTHDNKTTRHWYQTLSWKERLFTCLYLGCDGSQIHWRLIDCCLATEADLAAFPIQDALGLGAEGLMNTPGVAQGNWGWRLQASALTLALAAKIRGLNQKHGRCPRR